MVQTLNRWLYNINYRYAVDCLNILSFVTYIVNVILILYTRLELKTLVLSAKENCNWISNVIRRGLLILYSMIWGERWFCWYWWNGWPSLFTVSFVLLILVELLTITVYSFVCFVDIGRIVDHHCLQFRLFCWYW
jgi:hypothetical protein